MKLPSISIILSVATAVSAQAVFFIKCPNALGPCNNMCFAHNIKGKSGTLTRSTQGNRRTLSGCSQSPCTNTHYKSTGNTCDEYPYASSEEGGTGAILRCVPKTENSSQGGQLSAFYKANNVNIGDSYMVGVEDFGNAPFCKDASKQNDGTEFVLNNGQFVNAKRDVGLGEFEDAAAIPGEALPRNFNTLYEDSTGTELLLLVGGVEDFDPASMLGKEVFRGGLNMTTTLVKVL